MTARPTGSASWPERFRWGVRLTMQGLRRHRSAFFASAAGFACAVAALAACVALGRAPVAASVATGTAQLVAFRGVFHSAIRGGREADDVSGELALLRIELPFTNQGILREGCRGRYSKHEQTGVLQH